MRRWLSPLIASALLSCVQPPAPAPAPSPEPQVIQSRFGVFVQQSDGTVALHETTNVPLVPATEFGWWVRLRDPQGPLQWREELHLSAPPRSPGGATRVQPNVLVRDGVATPADGWIGQTWVIDDGNPEGEHTIRVFLDGSLAQEFSFRTYRVATSPATPMPQEPQGQGECIARSQCCKVCSKG